MFTSILTQLLVTHRSEGHFQRLPCAFLSTHNFFFTHNLFCISMRKQLMSLDIDAYKNPYSTVTKKNYNTNSMICFFRLIGYSHYCSIIQSPLRVETTSSHSPMLFYPRKEQFIQLYSQAYWLCPLNNLRRWMFHCYCSSLVTLLLLVSIVRFQQLPCVLHRWRKP